MTNITEKKLLQKKKKKFTKKMIKYLLIKFCPIAILTNLGEIAVLGTQLVISCFLSAFGNVLCEF